MMKHAKTILIGLTVILSISSFFAAAPAGYAQSSQGWSDPVNLSNAGSSLNPLSVIDSTGTIHVIWLDMLDGYKYSKSTDGVQWTPPKIVQLPFLPEDEAHPMLFPDPNGGVYVLWLDKTFSLFYNRVSSDFGQKTNWGNTRELAGSVVAFSAVVSPQGIFHVGYVSRLPTDDGPAGVYYRQQKVGNWSKPMNLYSSPYFRSQAGEDANIRLAVSEQSDSETVYMAWDDRLQKRIFMSRSLDGGSVWESNSLIRSSENSSGLETPFNINIGADGNRVLLLWQSGTPGEQCTQYSQWSVDGGKKFSLPEAVIAAAGACPQDNEIVTMNKDDAVVWLNILDDISLVAWNGSSWSQLRKQGEVSNFVNPATLDTVFFTGQNLSFYKDQLFVVGYDKGAGQDIWFNSRSLGDVGDWFPSSAEWTAPVEVANSDQRLSVLASVADNNNIVHAFWIQPPLLNAETGKATIEYAQWNGARWSTPTTILYGLRPDLTHLNIKADSQNRLLISWVDSQTGDISFTWANANNANKPSEWKKPQYVPSLSQTNNSPDILVDDAGRIVVAYAVPVNEHRGIYFAESADGGLTWTQPLQIFDALAADWDIVDQPNISLTGDGQLHVLFKRYASRVGERVSLGLYYSRSGDGGRTWSEPVIVSNSAVIWSEIYGYDRSIVHRLWQEYDRSTLVSFHQISRDSGATWSDPTILSSLADNPANLMTQTMDRAGNIHFMQLTGENNLTISDQMWNGSSWVSQKPKDLYITDRGAPSVVSISVSSKGNLLVSLLIDYPNTGAALKSDLLSLSKSLGFPKTLPPSSPAILEAVESPAGLSEKTQAAAQPSDQTTAVQNIPGGTSWLANNRNLIGLLLVGAILLLIIVVFRPLSRKQNDPKKTPQ